MVDVIPLQNASHAKLAQSVENNLFALFRAMATTLPGGELVETETLSHHLTFPSNPMFKGVWNTHLAPDEVDAVIEQTTAWYKERSAPYVYWWATDSTQPDNLADHLLEHGYQTVMTDSPGMTLDFSVGISARTPPGFKLVQAMDAQILDDWQRLYQTIYDSPPELGQAWVDATLSIGAENAPWQLYVGYLDNRPVGTNLVFRGAGVAGLFAIGTDPAARGQGIGTAITLLPLLDAQAEGYQYAVLFASDMGIPVYEKMGFRHTGRRFARYRWINR